MNDTITKTPNAAIIDSSSKDAKQLVDTIIDKNINKMDDYNKKAATVLKNQGIDEAVKHMFTDQDTGKPLSYSEMRYRYG